MMTPPIYPQPSDKLKAAQQKYGQEVDTGRYATPPELKTAIRSNQWTIRQALQVVRQVLPTADLTYENLHSISVAWLPYDERHIISYLRRNPEVFNRLVTLSSQNPQQPAWFNTTPIEALGSGSRFSRSISRTEVPLNTTPSILRAFPSQPQQEMQQLLQRVQQNFPANAPQNVQPQTLPTGQTVLPYGSLAWLARNPGAINQLGLTANEQNQLNTLLQPTILRLMDGLARNQQMMITPDLIRILVSLLFNPQIHGMLPLAAFETRNRTNTEETDLKDVEETEATDTDIMKDMILHLPNPANRFQRIELSARQIRDLCRRLKLSGGITLEELQNYTPLNEEEEELLRYLRQYHIFHAIADLNGRDETLDPSDLKLALEDKTLLLDDEHIQLVIKP